MIVIDTVFGPATIIARSRAASSIEPAGRPMIKIRVISGPASGKTAWIPSSR